MGTRTSTVHRVVSATGEIKLVLVRDPTPAKGDVPAQVSAAGEQRDADQAVQVVSLGQQPAVVGHDAVVGEGCGNLTAHLSGAEEDRSHTRNTIAVQ